MKKILIITLFGLKNYGNRLQNYAVAEIVKKLGYKPYSLRVGENDNIIIHNMKLLKRYLCHFLGIRKLPFKKSFKRFNKNIKTKEVRFDKIYTDNFTQKYDYVFLGGDQIWGAYRDKYPRDDYWFGGMFDKHKRVTMCPSFGGTWVAQEDKELFTKYLCEFEHISIREESGAMLVKEMTGKDATVVIDPVMALTTEEWKKVFDTKKYADNDYILSCLLGKDDEVIEQKINEIASGTDIKKLYRDTPESQEGPDGFLSLIYNAKVVCTDSFHCAAFSILFKKPLIVFDRAGFDKTQTTRLMNMLVKFGLTDRYIENIDNTKYYICDYNHIDGILDTEREKFYDFLKLTVEDI